MGVLRRKYVPAPATGQDPRVFNYTGTLRDVQGTEFKSERRVNEKGEVTQTSVEFTSPYQLTLPDGKTVPVRRVVTTTENTVVYPWG